MRSSIAHLCAAVVIGLLPLVALAQPQPGSGGHAPGAGASGGHAPGAGAVRPAQFISPAAQPAESAATLDLDFSGAQFGGTEVGTILGDDLGAACGPDGCNHCGRFGGPGMGPFGRGCFGGLYVRPEYILWGTKGADLPALVTTSPDDTDQNDAGVLGVAGTEILFGGESMGSNLRSGGRLIFGWWFDPCRRLGVEGEYVALRNESDNFRAESDAEGLPILGRPFFDIVDGEENASLTAFPDLTAGQIEADVQTRFQGAGVRAIYNLACGDGCGTSCITCCPVATGYRFDAIVGYRFLRVDDRVSVVENATSLDTGLPGSFFIRDLFESENQFHGIDLGTSMSLCKGCWSLDILSKIALGNTASRIVVDGSTVITENQQSETFTGGILAQRTNIGTRSFDEFAVAPELGVNIGYQLNACWRATLGYTFIYLSRVARAGDQIDRDLNPNLFPPEDPVATTHLRPEFNVQYTDFWAQGLTVGIEGSW